MSHVRTQIRNYVLNRLTGNTNAESRVYNSKITPNKGDFPVIGVYTPKDSFQEELSASPYEQRRVCTLEIHCSVVQNATFQDELDALCLQLEQFIDYRLGGGLDEIESCEYKDTEILLNREGEFPIATAIIIYEVTYIWTETLLVDPASLSDLNSLYVQWDMKDLTVTGAPGPDGQIDKTDEIQL